MTVDEKRSILYNYCEHTACKKCKLNTGDWEMPFLGGRYKTMRCLAVKDAKEEELNKALERINYGNA